MTKKIKCELIRSRRTTMAVQIKEGKVIIRAPYSLPLSAIEAFVTSHEAWIEKHLKEAEEQEINRQKLPPSPRKNLRP